MDREILFRGKRVDNGEYIQGFYAKSGDKALILIDNDILVGYVKAKEVIPETLCQYTGLTDKNGTKIFEGDLIKSKYEDVYKVYYEDNAFHIEDKWGNGIKPIQRAITHFECEVIGNIWDNSELLEDNND